MKPKQQILGKIERCKKGLVFIDNTADIDMKTKYRRGVCDLLQQILALGRVLIDTRTKLDIYKSFEGIDYNLLDFKSFTEKLEKIIKNDDNQFDN